MTYFSDRESGERQQTLEVIGESAWAGIQALIHSKVLNGSFGATYPVICPDGGVTGSDAKTLSMAIRAEVPGLPDPPWDSSVGEIPETVPVLDTVEFCWRSIGEPIELSFHSFPKHYHYEFDADQGRENFRETVNRIFSRNGLAYKLTNEGLVERIGPPVLRAELISAHFQSSDTILDGLLEGARIKFLSPRGEIRGEALQELWDAWERLKTTGEGSDKKEQITSLLDEAAGILSPQLRHRLETDAKELTDIGNSLQIRHFEVGKEEIQKSEHIDYLFHRLFGMIQLILKTKGT